MKFTVTVLTLLLLAGCGGTTKLLDRRPDYRGNTTANPLEIPPDLTSSTIDDTLLVPELTPEDSANLSDYSRDRSGGQISPEETVLREQTGLRIERAGSQRWLVVEQNPTQLWPRLKEFWTSGGFALAKDDPRIGIMETEWLENRADIPDGPIRNVLKRFVDFAYAAPTRDKFRIRLERGENDTISDVYLTHYGVEEIVTKLSGNSNRASTTGTWVSRPADPELQAEMLNRLMVYLGASERRAQSELAKTGNETTAGPRAQLVDDPSGQKGLLIEQDYDRSWRLVGLALDGGRFLVEDQNRAEGLYLVEYRENPDAGGSSDGLLSRLVFWRKKQAGGSPPDARYRVRLAGRGPQTLVVVHDDKGQPANSATAQLILDKVRETVQ